VTPGKSLFSGRIAGGPNVTLQERSNAGIGDRPGVTQFPSPRVYFMTYSDFIRTARPRISLERLKNAVLQREAQTGLDRFVSVYLIPTLL
jgi:hypothetical protein